MRDENNEQIERERDQILEQFRDWMEMPMLVFGFVWLILLIVDLTLTLNPFFLLLFNIIWVIFIFDFVVEFALSPRKLKYLRSNWLTAVSLVIPALRIFRVFRALRVLRAFRAARGVQLVRLLASVNRGMRALGASMSRRGLPFVLGLTVIVILAGGAGMYAFEREAAENVESYAEFVWWTAMVITTMGSEYWPRTPEGRMLCLFLAVYAFSVFGYVTASLTTFFVGSDVREKDKEPASGADIEAVSRSLEELRQEVRRLGEKSGPKKKQD